MAVKGVSLMNVRKVSISLQLFFLSFLVYSLVVQVWTEIGQRLNPNFLIFGLICEIRRWGKEAVVDGKRWATTSSSR